MTSFAHQLRQALITTFDSSVGPVLLDLEAKANAEERANLAAHWKQRHGGAVAEARRQAYRARLLEDALRDVLRTFPQLDPGMPTWDQWSATSRKVPRRQLSEWGQLIPSSRRGRDWRRHSVLRTRRDATNRERDAAQRAASTAQASARNAVELHRQELKARSEAEIGWRAALAEVERLKGELGDAPQRIAKERAAADRFAHHADIAFRDRAAEERRHAETKRRYASTIRQAQREHRRADQLAAEVEQLRAKLADHQLAASEAQGAATRAFCGESIPSPLGFTATGLGPCIRPAYPRHDEHRAADGATWAELAQRPPRHGDHVRVTIDGELEFDPRGYGSNTLVYRNGPGGTAVGYFSIPPSATVTVLATAEPQQASDGHEVEIAGHAVGLTGPNAAAVAAVLRAQGRSAPVVATADGFVDLRALAQEQLRQAQAQEAAHVDRVLLGVEPSPWVADGVRAEVLFPQLAKYAAECERRDQAAPCWCGHDPDAHVTDDSDNAICRGCFRQPTTRHQAFHVHTPS